MLHLEIKLVWFSRWSYTKFLFLAIRYLPFIEIVVCLHSKFDPTHIRIRFYFFADQLIPDVSGEKCKVFFLLEICKYFIQFALFAVNSYI
jgi:hypothetical protein